LVEVALPKDALLAVRPEELAVTDPPPTLSEVEAFSEPMVEVPKIALAPVIDDVAVMVPAVSVPMVLFAEVTKPLTVVFEAFNVVTLVVAKLDVEVAVRVEVNVPP
jgi:hypothetical protein